ncbi:MAG: PBP1A family penicillin-binding protein [Pseudomonadota bacterium]
MIDILKKISILTFRWTKAIIIFLVTLTFVFLAAITTAYFYFSQDLPNIKSLQDYKPPVISEVFAANGQKVGEFWEECRIFTEYDKIPNLVKLAFIDSEDANFFSHRGVDFRAIVRAFIANIQAGKIKEGGSTITQQLTRSLLLSKEKTYARKIKEAILAIRLERSFDKEQILTLYLNQIYLGNRSYGVAAAARNYFHKELDALTIAEIALIAGLPSAPHAYSPLINPAAARSKQLYVIKRLLEQEHITKDEAKKNIDAALTLYKAPTDQEYNQRIAPYFVEHVRRIVKDQYGDDELYHRGLKIYTTLDVQMQEFATQALRHGVEALDHRQGFRGVNQIKVLEKNPWDTAYSFPPGKSIAILPTPSYADKLDLFEATVTGFDNQNTKIRIKENFATIEPSGIKWARSFNTKMRGYEDATYVRDPRNILAIGDRVYVTVDDNGKYILSQWPKVQGALFAMEPSTGFVKAIVGGYDNTSEFNRATQALRQPGSSFKPFVYAAALDKGYTYSTIINDSEIEYEESKGKMWTPKNYSNKFKGPTTFHNALVFSRNVPTVKITFDIGVNYLTAFARKFGFTSQIDKYLSMALGANAVYLNELVPAYAVFANNGIYKPPLYITKIVDRFGTTLEEKESQPKTAKPENVENNLDLNDELFSRELHQIEDDGVVLSNTEMKILYGKDIPKDHVITPRTAYLTTQLLTDVVKYGTGQRVRALKLPVAGKTGTTNDETDAWFVGFTPKLAAGVWLGFDELVPIGRGEQGGQTAAPVFLAFMQKATSILKENPDFKAPDDFPSANIATLTGGSSPYGAKPNLELPEEAGGTDRAGQFFEEELEDMEAPE